VASLVAKQVKPANLRAAAEQAEEQAEEEDDEGLMKVR